MDKRAVILFKKIGFVSVVLFAFVFVLLLGSGIAATLTCGFESSCGDTEFLFFENDTGGMNNSHVQNVSIGTYAYNLCCSVDSGTLDNSCEDAVFLRLSNETNAHAQVANYSGTQYSVPACISVDPGKVECSYTVGSCSGGQVCMGSIASSEVGDNNETNAHYGSCGYYETSICCSLNSAPVVSSVTLSSTYGYDMASENLTVTFSEIDADSDPFTNITDWRVDGSSLAILNLPFDTNVSTNGTGDVRDFSSNGNNGTLGSGISSYMPLWNSSGKIGAGYSFNKGAEHINFGDINEIENSNFTISMWVKIDDLGSDNDFLAKGTHSTSQPLLVWFDSSVASADVGGSRTNTLSVILYDGSTQHWVAAGNNALNNNNWNYIVVTFDNDANNLSIYINGVLSESHIKPTNGVVANANELILGSNTALSTSNSMDGEIDEFLIFDRPLSKEQIAYMYKAQSEGRGIDRFVSQEIERGEDWSVVVTGSDGYSYGSSSSSNTVSILTPSVSLVGPVDSNVTTNRTPIFNWSSNIDGLPIGSFEINITEVMYAGSNICNDDIFESQSAGTSEYIPDHDLRCLNDNGYSYLWSVRPYDGEDYGSWETYRILNISAVVQTTFLNNEVLFGSLSQFGSDDTTDNSPRPLIVENSGNVFTNLSFNATALWNSQVDTSSYYRFKIDENSTETGSFDIVSSLTSWVDLPNVFTGLAVGVVEFNYTNTNDTAEIDLYVETPNGENPGVKNSTIYILSRLAE